MRLDGHRNNVYIVSLITLNCIYFHDDFWVLTKLSILALISLRPTCRNLLLAVLPSEGPTFLFSVPPVDEDLSLEEDWRHPVLPTTAQGDDRNFPSSLTLLTLWLVEPKYTLCQNKIPQREGGIQRNFFKCKFPNLCLDRCCLSDCF